MRASFVNIDRNTPMLLPPDLREWVPEDDMVHFVLEAVETVPVACFKVNWRGSGSPQYPPRMMLALLIYCYSNGVMGSRRIERATYRDLAVRYITADRHPDHSTICDFRKDNFDAFAEAFLHVLRLAREMGVLQVGTISVDGTHIQANASITKSLQYQRSQELDEKLRRDIEQLLEDAEQADRDDDGDGQSLPEEIRRREKLRAKMQKAQKDLERQARQRTAAETARHEKDLAEWEQSGKEDRGPKPKKVRHPKPKPKPTEQVNLTDPDSKVMRKSRRSEYRQAYNAQAAVDADGSQLILSNHVTNNASDWHELIPAVTGIDASVGTPERVLADGGYMDAASVWKLESQGLDAYLPVGSPEEYEQRRYEYRPPKTKQKRTVKDPYLLKMREKMRSDEGRRLYGLRKQTVEPVFGVIKSAMGFRQFLLRGLRKVAGEWSLVCLAYNMKRLYALSRPQTA